MAGHDSTGSDSQLQNCFTKQRLVCVIGILLFVSAVKFLYVNVKVSASNSLTKHLLVHSTINL